MILEYLAAILDRGESHQESRKAVTALFPYAIWRRQNGQGDMLDVFFRIARANEEETLSQTSANAASPKRQGFLWHRAEPFITNGVFIRSIRQLKDVNIIQSYLLLLWSERWPLRPNGLSEMQASVREDFSGIGMGDHRRDLNLMLDQFLEQLDNGQGSPELEMKDQYCSLKEALMEVEERA